MLWVKAARPQKCMVLVFVNTCEHACHFGIEVSSYQISVLSIQIPLDPSPLWLGTPTNQCKIGSWFQTFIEFVVVQPYLEMVGWDDDFKKSFGWVKTCQNHQKRHNTPLIQPRTNQNWSKSLFS